MKKIRFELLQGVPSTTLREIALLQQLKHPNIVAFQDVIYDYDEKGKKEKKLTLVFEYVDHV